MRLFQRPALNKNQHAIKSATVPVRSIVTVFYTQNMSCLVTMPEIYILDLIEQFCLIHMILNYNAFN